MAAFLAARATYRGLAKVAGKLYDLGRFPAAIAEPNAWVHGDVYDLDAATLAELDVYENVESPQPSYFARELCTVELLTGEPVTAWVYWFHGPLPGDAVLIASGQYEKVFSANV